LTTLNTTLISVSDSVIKKTSFVEIEFRKTGITQIIKPLLDEKLMSLVQRLQISEHTISKIESNIFDELPKLEKLDLDNNQIDDKLLNNGLVKSNFGKKVFFYFSWLSQSLSKNITSINLGSNNITKV
jgi:Leucine-rich repeat (LRR) protein